VLFPGESEADGLEWQRVVPQLSLPGVAMEMPHGLTANTTREGLHQLGYEHDGAGWLQAYNSRWPFRRRVDCPGDCDQRMNSFTIALSLLGPPSLGSSTGSVA
jgi:hypothetical protein